MFIFTVSQDYPDFFYLGSRINGSLCGIRIDSRARFVPQGQILLLLLLPQPPPDQGIILETLRRCPPRVPALEALSRMASPPIYHPPPRRPRTIWLEDPSKPTGRLPHHIAHPVVALTASTTKRLEEAAGEPSVYPLVLSSQLHSLIPYSYTSSLFAFLGFPVIDTARIHISLYILSHHWTLRDIRTIDSFINGLYQTDHILTVSLFTKG